MGYLVGVLVGDHKRTKDGHGLSVKKEFAKYDAKKYWETAGVKLKIHEKDGYWKTYDNAGWLKELWYSKLWKVVAYVYPLEFLKGLFDSEGAVSPRVDHKKRALYSVKISLVNGDGEIIIGENSYIGNFSTVQAYKGCKVIIGANCAISHNVRIYTANRKAEDVISEKQNIGINIDLILPNSSLCPLEVDLTSCSVGGSQTIKITPWYFPSFTSLFTLNLIL